MKSFLLCLLLAGAGAFSATAATDDEVAARKIAYDVAGAFTNDGFRLRDGCWNGTLAPGKPHLLQVNLYAGNQYWFSVGATSAARKIAISIYDEAGKALAIEPFAEEGKAAAGYAPAVSGTYYVKVESSEGGPATFCLLYSYK